MNQVFVLQKSFQRIADSLASRVPQAEIVCWESDGSISRNGQAVQVGDVAPNIGWIGSDIFSGGHLADYSAVLQAFPSLRWVQSAHAGLDAEIYRTLARQGVRLTKSSAQSIPIAEYVMTYALEHFQNVPQRRAAQAQKQWTPHRFRELWHATWLIIGYGHIGRGVARRAKAFDSKVIAIRASGAADEFADEMYTLDDLPEQLSRADIVVLACPATEQTRGLANAAFFAGLNDDALLINVARGSLLNQTALLDGLAQARPSHAVLDVFEVEPLPAASPLWAHPRVTVTAHTSNAGGGTRLRGDELFLANLERFVAGRPLIDEVDLGRLV